MKMNHFLAFSLLSVFTVSNPLFASFEGIENLIESQNEKRGLSKEIRHALRISFRCGNQKCEANIGETSKSCPLDCGRLKVVGSEQSISGYNMGTQCSEVKKVFVPKSLEEMKNILSTLNQEGAQKIRFVGTRHSANSTICSKENVIITMGLNHILRINDENPENLSVEVESGTTHSDSVIPFFVQQRSGECFRPDLMAVLMDDSVSPPKIY
jgi:FAD binding domain